MALMAICKELHGNRFFEIIGPITSSHRLKLKDHREKLAGENKHFLNCSFFITVYCL